MLHCILHVNTMFFPITLIAGIVTWPSAWDQTDYYRMATIAGSRVACCAAVSCLNAMCLDDVLIETVLGEVDEYSPNSLIWRNP
jgi:hypothetical protein